MTPSTPAAFLTAFEQYSIDRPGILLTHILESVKAFKIALIEDRIDKKIRPENVDHFPGILIKEAEKRIEKLQAYMTNTKTQHFKHIRKKYLGYFAKLDDTLKAICKLENVPNTSALQGRRRQIALITCEIQASKDKIKKIATGVAPTSIKKRLLTGLAQTIPILTSAFSANQPQVLENPSSSLLYALALEHHSGVTPLGRLLDEIETYIASIETTVADNKYAKAINVAEKKGQKASTVLRDDAVSQSHSVQSLWHTKSLISEMRKLLLLDYTRNLSGIQKDYRTACSKLNAALQKVLALEKSETAFLVTTERTNHGVKMRGYIATLTHIMKMIEDKHEAITALATTKLGPAKILKMQPLPADSQSLPTVLVLTQTENNHHSLASSHPLALSLPPLRIPTASSPTVNTSLSSSRSDELSRTPSSERASIEAENSGIPTPPPLISSTLNPSAARMKPAPQSTASFHTQNVNRQSATLVDHSLPTPPPTTFPTILAFHEHISSGNKPSQQSSAPSSPPPSSNAPQRAWPTLKLGAALSSSSAGVALIILIMLAGLTPGLNIGLGVAAGLLLLTGLGYLGYRTYQHYATAPQPTPAAKVENSSSTRVLDMVAEIEKRSAPMPSVIAQNTKTVGFRETNRPFTGGFLGKAHSTKTNSAENQAFSKQTPTPFKQ